MKGYDILSYHGEIPQQGFISDETQHNISYIKYNIPPKQFNRVESFLDEDKRNIVGIDIPCCRLNRH